MKVRDTQTGEELDSMIERATPADFKAVMKDKHRFDKKFRWSSYKNEEVYKICLKNDTTILGMMCIKDHTDLAINAIQIELLEISEENIGKKKRIDSLGGCLIAWACRLSFSRGHEGVVFLVPKTGLVEHYNSLYGFEPAGMRTVDRPHGIMVLEGRQSAALIKKYLDQV